MGALSQNTGAPALNWEENTSCIYVFGYKMVTTRVKHIDITVYFLQEQFDNDLFIPKDEKSSIMPSDMCTKPCSGSIISQSTKWMIGFRLYPTSDTEHYKPMRLDDFVMK